ncbi:tunicamycin resistance protein [Saitoella coloradoensis]
MAMTRRLLLLAGTASSAALLFNPQKSPLVSSLGFAILAFISTYTLIPLLGDAFIKAGFKGKDLNKPGTPVIPETMGAVTAFVYLACMLLFIPFAFYHHFAALTSGGGNREVEIEIHPANEGFFHPFPHNKLGEYLSAILSLQSMIMLGVADDLFDIRWRHKLFMPLLAAIPILAVYYVDFGVTHVVVPMQLRQWLGDLVDLGWLYYAYMAALTIFCTNSINILAGVNGIEAGQSLIIALFVVGNDIPYLIKPLHPAHDSHLLSLYFMAPFIGVTLGLLKWNWFPARVFVGDTYCYFAGMTFAVVGILGHFSKTLLLFFIPQIFNFLYSSPQLFGIVENPRHRLPRLNTKTGKLEQSRVKFTKTPKGITVLLLELLQKAGMVTIVYGEEGEILEATNLTIINLILVRLGPMREDILALTIMGVQVLGCALGLLIRYNFAYLIYEWDHGRKIC